MKTDNHYFIYIKDGTLRLIRTMPDKSDCYYGEALQFAKADSVEIAPNDKELVMHRLVNDKHTPFESQDDVKDGIYEITTNGVFEVKHKGFFNGGKVEWVRGHAPTNDYEELAFYKEEAKPEQPKQLFTVWDKVNQCESRNRHFIDSSGLLFTDCDPHGVNMSGIRTIVCKPNQYELRRVNPVEQPEAESQLDYIESIVKLYQQGHVNLISDFYTIMRNKH